MLKVWLVLVAIFFICIACIGASSVARKGNRVVSIRNMKGIFKSCLDVGTYGVPFLLLLFAAKEIIGLAMAVTGGTVNFYSIVVVYGLLLVVGIVARIATYTLFTFGRVAEGAYYLWEIREYPLADSEE